MVLAVLDGFFGNPTVIGACVNGRGFGGGAVGGVGLDVIGEPRCIDDDQLPTGAQKSLPVEQSGQRIAQGPHHVPIGDRIEAGGFELRCDRVTELGGRIRLVLPDARGRGRRPRWPQ